MTITEAMMVRGAEGKLRPQDGPTLARYDARRNRVRVSRVVKVRGADGAKTWKQVLLFTGSEAAYARFPQWHSEPGPGVSVERFQSFERQPEPSLGTGETERFARLGFARVPEYMPERATIATLSAERCTEGKPAQHPYTCGCPRRDPGTGETTAERLTRLRISWG